nr:MAG TPA: hypothetical protein [Caudoviricetes sp.]
MQNDSELLRQIFILRNNITGIKNNTGLAGYNTRKSRTGCRRTRWGSIYSPYIARSSTQAFKLTKKPLLNINPKIFQKNKKGSPHMAEIVIAT